jgi:hypothetical protein
MLLQGLQSSLSPGKVIAKHNSIYKAAARDGLLLITAFSDKNLSCSGNSYDKIVDCLNQCDKQEIVLI